MDIFTAWQSDIVFVQREAFMTGSTYFEWMFKLSPAKLIFDFDDSIWLQDDSPVNNKLSWLKNPAKTSKIISYSDMVFAGNEFLAQYARQYAHNVKIVPTTIDIEEYSPRPNDNSKVIIGWSGSFSTVKHFESAIPALEKIKEKLGVKIGFKLIGDGNYVNTSLDIKGLPWVKEDEIAELCKIDIGIMPLPDDKWASGKCGLKGLQYMALGIPTIMSPVGVNSEIIQDGENGYLASHTDEWEEKLTRLVNSANLRTEMGEKGRDTVSKLYSTDVIKHLYVDYFNEVLNS